MSAKPARDGEHRMGRLLRRNILIEAGISLFLLCFFVWVALHTERWVAASMPTTISPAFFPKLTAAFLAVASALLACCCFRAVLHMLRGEVDEEQRDLQEGGEEAGRFLALGGYVAILFLYLAGLHLAGFLLSTPIAMLLVSLMLGLRRWLTGLVCYALFTLLLNHAVFAFMNIILPAGVLFD